VPENGIGFGLGFAARTQPGRNPLPGSVGDYSWSGVSGTYFWTDPKHQLIAVLMMQAPIQGNLQRIFQFWVRLRPRGCHSPNDSADLKRNSLLKGAGNFCERTGNLNRV
jgi:CubicO group peptidase (beta-lactamase class C family)